MQAIVDATLTTRPPAGTHWSSRALAEAQRVSDGTIRKIWRQHGLQPHRVGQFKLSTDPHFVEKLRDVVGLYLNPPANAVVFCVDEKSGIQALDRTRPVLPLRPGVPERQTHDYVRYGTTTLYAALRVLDGVVIGECRRRHRSQEFVQFLRRLDRATPPDQPLHLILDNLSAHKSPQVRRWLTRHPRVHFHFVPTSSSWLNLVERWFAEITRTRLRRGTFTSVPALERAIHDYLTHYNQHAKPFIWTKDADTILAKVDRCKEARHLQNSWPTVEQASGFGCKLVTRAQGTGIEAPIHEETQARPGIGRGSGKSCRLLRVGSWVDRGHHVTDGYVTRRMSWSAVSASTPNMQWHITFAGPRTRTWRPPNSSLRRPLTRSTAVRSL